MSIYNNYVLTPRNTVEYSAFRGVTDFTKIGQFDQFETGYPWLAVLGIPNFLRGLAKEPENNTFKRALAQFTHALEYEFRGLSGLPDMTADTMEITDGINSQRLINKVTRETSATVSMPYYEKNGALFTKLSEYYLSGIKDPISQAKTYHGLIRAGKMLPGPENEIFTFLYWVTDNTMLRVQKAFLLANSQLTKAETSIYDATRGDMSNKEISLEFNTYVITGYEVDMAAYTLLQDITGVQVVTPDGVQAPSNFTDLHTENQKLDNYAPAALDSTVDTFHYGIFNKDDEVHSNSTLVGAIGRAKQYSHENPHNYDAANL